MRLLLDTQVVVLAARTPERLSASLRAALLDPTVPRWVSLVSLWEIAIKRTSGKLVMADDIIDRALLDLAADELPVARHHVLGVSSLPLHHRDPFDRLLIAQARAENLVIATANRHFAAYGVDVLSA